MSEPILVSRHSASGKTPDNGESRCWLVLAVGSACKKESEPAKHTTLQLSEKDATKKDETTPSATAKPATPPQAAPEPSPAALDLKPFIELSPDVLVGTDVTPLEQLSSSIGTVPEGGVFVSDQGGATVKITVKKQDGMLTLDRTYSEPGRDEFSKTYQLRVAADGHSAGQGSTHLLALKDDVLVFEKEPGVDGFPEGTWLLYSPAKGED